jgi:hypothetical protein
MFAALRRWHQGPKKSGGARARRRAAHPRDEITSVFALNGASTALARNALREPGAPVYFALRYRAAYGPTYR